MWREKNREGERDIDYTELAHVIMEADQFWDGQSELAGNQEKVVHGVASNPSSKAWGPESWWYSSSPNAGRFKTQEEPEFQFFGFVFFFFFSFIFIREVSREQSFSLSSKAGTTTIISQLKGSLEGGVLLSASRVSFSVLLGFQQIGWGPSH